ncbi:histone-lysine N-methyltransferase, H3 lysine-79 specific-like [Argopecten irradians]|uniref:histone-lysine N-methyltransferase, H3 lysine-79 specific-like n=1 Tax=Argopecten irradians TaxID=31199 RepID=UPI00371252E1
MVDKDPRFCYHDNNEKMCCGTCNKHNTGVTGCEYGDRLPNCTLKRCSEESYSKKCCKTCSQFKPEPKLEEPVLPLQESFSSTISMSQKTNSSNEGSVPVQSPVTTESPLNQSLSESPTTQEQIDKENSLAISPKVEGIKVTELGPITPLKPLTPLIDTVTEPLVSQATKHLHNRKWKSRDPIQSKTLPRSRTLVVSPTNDVPLNQTSSVKLFSNNDASTSLNSVVPKQRQVIPNDKQVVENTIESINVLESRTTLKQERENRQREQQLREQQEKEQREYRLKQERLQREQEQKERLLVQQEREKRQREQQQTEQRQREQQLREQRQREQKLREERQREQQLQEQRLREQKMREQRQREQQLREQRQREQQLREQRQRERHLAQQRQRERYLREQQKNTQIEQHGGLITHDHNRKLGSTQFIVQPKYRSKNPRIFHVNRFPAASRSTNVLNKLRQNSIRPKVTTTTTTTTTPAPPPLVLASIFSRPEPEQCVKPEARFMTLRCDWLVRLMKGLCKNSILGKVCCEDCIPVQQHEPVCIDDIDCPVKHAAQCYDDLHRSKCCSTCSAFKTEYSDCEYGDRQNHCDLFMRYMPNYTCDAFRKSCCLSCKSRRIEITTVPPVVMTTARWSGNVWDSSFNSRNAFHQHDRTAESNNIFHWKK